jgi:hypothetical protein
MNATEKKTPLEDFVEQHPETCDAAWLAIGGFSIVASLIEHDRAARGAYEQWLQAVAAWLRTADVTSLEEVGAFAGRVSAYVVATQPAALRRKVHDHLNSWA